MIPRPRPKNQKYFHISVYLLHKDLLYLIPTIQLDVRPLNNDKLHIRIYLFTVVIQLEIIWRFVACYCSLNSQKSGCLSYNNLKAMLWYNF